MLFFLQSMHTYVTSVHVAGSETPADVAFQKNMAAEGDKYKILNAQMKEEISERLKRLDVVAPTGRLDVFASTGGNDLIY